MATRMQSAKEAMAYTMYTWGQTALAHHAAYKVGGDGSGEGKPMVTQPMAMPFLRGNQLEITFMEQM